MNDMHPIRCIIVDDEPPAIQLLEKFAGMIDYLEVVGTCSNAVQAFNLLQKEKVDLLFLDIQMPVLNGLDFLKSLSDPPSVIITTAYREYALEGYDLDVIDYLLKPISFDRFLKSIERYRKNTLGKAKIEKHHLEENSKTLFVNINRSKHRIIVDNVWYLESLKDYVKIHMKDENLVVKGNLGTNLKLFPLENFVRIHRSFAINIDHLKSFNTTEVSVGDVMLPIGPKYKDVIVERFGME